MHTDVQREPAFGAAPAVRPTALPPLLTVGDAAAVLRTTRKAIYAMIERGQLPGVVRIGRRVLVREPDLVSWLCQNTRVVAGKVERR